MKKLISVSLVLIMLFAVMAPAVSAGNYEYLPIIYIRGNGDGVYYPDGTRCVATFDDLGLALGGDEESDGISKDVVVETAVNILKPFVLEGMLFDNWDNYGRAIYDEISPLFPDAGLDENGNPKKGTAPSKADMDYSFNQSCSANSYYWGMEYDFCYDWRLSPYDTIDRLHEYVQRIMSVTGKSRVNMYARCVGGSILAAYLEKYGHLGHVKNVVFSDVLFNGSTLVSKAFSGQIEFDAKMMERYMGQLDFCGQIDEGIGFAFTDVLNEIVFKTMDFFNQINVTDQALDGVEQLYEKLYKALIPALCHATGVATQINYWTCVEEEDMDTALNLLFGKEGSELRVKYAGLIDKIQLYRSKVSKDLTAYYDSLKAKNIHVGFIGKYGFMNAPITKESELLSDSLVSLTHATMGATTAPIGKTLSQEYIDSRIAEGKGRYISPDKQVDLSTAYSPDTTWIFKNGHHNMFEPIRYILNAFLNGTNETVDSVGVGSQFMVYSYDTDSVTPMTQDNCADYDWITKPVEEPTTETRLVSFMRFFTMILNFFTKLFKGELDFSNLLG